VWATAPEACAWVGGYGFRARPVVPGRPSPGDPPTSALDLSAVPSRQRRALFFGRRFGAAATRTRAALAGIVDEERPDMVLHDLAELSAAPVAAARGIPQVTVAFSGALSDPLVQGIVDAVADVWDAEGLAVPPDAGLYTHLYLHRFPPAFGAAPAGATVRFIRPVGFDGGGDTAAPDWVSGLGTHRRAVYVTLGTVVSGAAQWAELLAALDSLDVDAVATTGRQLDPAALGPVPDNVRVERYVPQSFVLGRVSALVSHAGAGSLLAGAERGLPQLCVPMGADMWDNADALTAAGAGLTLEEDERSAGDIHAALVRLLEEDTFSTAARRVAAEIADLPHPDDHVSTLQSLVSG
jgi:hypothetical protein